MANKTKSKFSKKQEYDVQAVNKKDSKKQLKSIRSVAKV
jgi:hypothetical protein